MKYAAVLKAEDDWRCALVNTEGKVFFKKISEWGFVFQKYKENKMITKPLDYLGKDISALENYICVVNPNEEVDMKQLEYLAVHVMSDMRNRIKNI